MAAAVAFAKTHAMEIKESVNKTPLLEYFKATGEIPDGTEYVSSEDKFFLQAGE